MGFEPDIRTRRFDWMEWAVCKDVHPDLFGDQGDLAIARRLCAVCPVLTDCHRHVAGLANFTGIAAGRRWSTGSRRKAPPGTGPSGERRGREEADR